MYLFIENANLLHIGIIGDSNLKVQPLEIGIQTSMPMRELFALAQTSMRKCVCEGRLQTVGDILQCKECGHTACPRCAGRPEHNYAAYAKGSAPRVSPHAFMHTIVGVIPMCVKLGGFSEEDLEAIKPDDVTDKLWKKWVCNFFCFIFILFIIHL